MNINEPAAWWGVIGWSGHRLHHVADFNEQQATYAYAVCGKEGQPFAAETPILRCAACCRITNTPRGSSVTDSRL